MSNSAYIVRTKFTDMKGQETFGYRIFDDYESDYYNGLDKEDIASEGLDFLELIIGQGSFGGIFPSITGHLYEMQRGIYIDDDWFDYETIAPIFIKADEWQE